MPGLRPMLGLATRLLGGILTPVIDQISAASARLLRKLALLVVAGVAMVVVLIALTIALALWIASLWGPIIGALAVAGVYLLVAGVAVFMALRPARPSSKTHAASGKARAAAAGAGNADRDAGSGTQAQVDAFAAPLLAILQRLGLRREQLAVLAGTSVAKQLGPVPLVALAVVAGFLVGRMWKSWRGLLSSDLVAGLLSADLLATLFGSRREPDDSDEA